ncbi:T1SS-143 domain-containing protein [Rhizobium sp. ERR 1071]|uniref:beta strand repeat-containing protein n=1 Tax=Rhizobium sp. ERR 1071 TaxID=2572677 RepID=UPI00119ACDFB|nr:VCBS domain-containing protein [Rhizobium sp. ERR1071]TWB11628.1 T1SS-143 domain-containing protein [Rhizobium sp. ERR1071]
MDDLRISTVDHEAASHDLASSGRDEGIAADAGPGYSPTLSQNADVAAFEVAQAEEQQANGKTGRLAANEPQNAPATAPIQIVPDQGNVVHLPPNTSIDDIHVEGRNLVLIQADGTRIVIINGALHVPTFLIGEVTLPQQAVVAALQQQGINVAEGPDGSVHAGNGADSGHQFTDSQAGNPRTPLNLIGLLGPGDLIGGGNGGNLSGTQTRVPFIDPQATETASLVERGSSTGAFLTSSSTGRFGFGGNNASITTVTLVGEAEITSSGTQQLSGLTSGGVAVVVTQNGQTVTGVANGVTVFTLVFNASTGEYTFTQLAALDHPRGANSASDVLELQFRYTVSDTSGHTVSAVASVDITDSVPVAAVGTAGSVTEAALASGNAVLTHDTGAATATGSLNISWGADSANTDKGGLGDRSVAFTNATVAATGEDNGVLTSHGLAVHTVILANGTLVGYTGEVAPTATSASNVVFYATVSDTDNGHYNFTLVQSLDDAKGSNAITLTFGYTATDSDGDTATNSFTVTVADDKPVASTGDVGSVTEAALAAGNAALTHDTGAATATGSLNISWGADNANTDKGGAGDRSVAFANATVAATGEDNGVLTSHGLAVHTVILANGTLVGYTGEVAPTATSASNVVFYATVSDTDNGHYNFTLVQSLDDAKGSNAITLTFGYTATDSDGDTATNSFTITVADDKPVASTGDAGSVTEAVLAAGNAALTHDTGAAMTTGSLNISWGADNANTDKGGAGDRSVAFTNATVVATGENNGTLSSHGLAVHTALLADGTLVGYTGDVAPTAVTDAKSVVGSNIVFYATVSDTDNGHYNFTLVQSLDDAKGSDAITLTFGYTATDSDGDTATNSFTITVADDKPVASDVTVGTGSLYDTTPTEQMPLRPLVESSEGSTPSESATDSVSGGSGSLFTAGADGFQQISFTDPTGLKGIYIDANGVAHKEGLSYSTTTDNLGNTVYTATGKESGQVLFTLSVGADGSYTYVQSGAFADAKGSDNENFKISFEVTDGDGDKAIGSLTLNVADSLPVANNVMVESGSLHDTTSTSSETNPSPVQLLVEQPSEGSPPSHGAKSDSVSGAAGSLFTTGTDGFARLTFTNPTGLKAINIDENGVAHKEGLSYSTSRDDSGDTIYTAIGRDSGHVIFTLTVHADGSYTYVQSGAFADAKGSDNENFKIGFEVTDGDGDKSTGSLTLNVADSLPTASTVTAEHLLNDDMFTGGNPDKTDEYNSVSGASGSLFNTGADGFKKVAIAHSDLPTLTTIYTDADGVAHQEAVSWSKAQVTDGSTTWVASSAHHETVATLIINADGSYTFSTGAPLAHPTAQADEETLSLTFNFTVTDGDGDKATGSLTVGVKDDVPIAHTVDNTASSVNDDAQTGGNLDRNGADTNSVSGAAGALFSAGADGFSSVSIDQSSLPALKTIYLDANGFAQQEDVTWGKPTVSGGATTWVAYSANHETVATLTINADGSYSFSTSAPLVHPTSGTTEESLPLTFTFTVTDGDNDTSTGSLTLHVTDDVPLANTVIVTNVTLNDDALKGGNPDTVGVADTDSVSGTSGTLFTGGADGVHQVTLGATTDFNAIYTGKDGFAHVESVVWGSPTMAAGGETIWVATGKDSGQTVATLTIGTDGSYSFTLSAPIAHGASQTAENTQDLTFNFTVTDGDSDTASGALTVTVKDDAPIAYKVDVTSTLLNDDAQAHGNLDGGSADVNTINGNAGALFSAGADGVKSVSMDSLPTLKAIYLDSHGIGHQESVTWASSSTNGVTTWTATGASSHATVAVLTIGSDGSYSFTTDAPLVHSTSSTTEDSLTLNFGFTVTDGDGDAAKGSLAIAITDDVPVASGTTISVRADEGDIYNALSQGNSPLDGTHDGSSSQPALIGLGFAATVSGSVASTVSFGADGAAVGGGFSFTSNATSTLAALHLTSGGEALSYAVVNNVIIGYVDNDHHSGFNPLVDRPVLSLSLSGGGNFTFQQYDQLDNVAGPGNDLRSGNGSISAIDFGSVIQATDGDGDRVTLTGALKVTIVDDTPRVDLALTGSITIDESGSGDNDVSASNAVKSLFAGITGGTDPYMSTVYAQHNVVSPSISMGADDAPGTSSSLTLHIDNADSGLKTSAGQPITLSQLADGTVVGKIGDGEIAFAIRIDDSGKVSIAQYMSLANPNTSKSDGDMVDLTGKLSAVLSATDSDGDTVAKSVSIGSSIRFDDDGPSIGGAVSTKTLAEHDLVTNSGSLSPSGVSTGAVALNFAFGADGPAAHAITFVARSNGSYFTASYGNNQSLDATKLSSGGHALSYSVSSDGMTLIAYTGSNAADQSSWVFKVALSQDSGHATGAYDFTLYKSLDDVNDQTNLSDIKLTFQVAGHDGDGDTTTGTQSFSVDVIDDVPALADHASVSATVSETAINAPAVTTASYAIDFDTVNPAAAKLTVSEGSVSDGHVESSSKGGDIVLVSNTGTTFVLTQMDIGVFDHKGASSKTVTIIGTDANGNTYSVTTTGTTFSATGTALEGKQLTSLEIDPHDNSLTITLDNIHVIDTTTTPTNAPAETTLDLTSLVHAGADSPLIWSVNAITTGTSSGSLTGGTGLTYNGAAITLASADGHTITGSAAGVTVFTLTVDPATGHAIFDLYHPIDGGKTLPLDFSKYLTATDFDGDSVTLSGGSATIVVQSATDSLPTISSASLVSSVSESGLPGGTGTAGVANVHSGSIAITAGDAPSIVTINGHTFNVGTAIANGDTNATIQGAHGTLHILSVTTTAINYTYTLTGATSGASNHDDFAVKISDAPIDGESQTATLTFNISDDKPIASTVSLGSMLENDNPTFTLAAGTIAFGADGAAANGAIHVDSVKATGDLAGLTLSPSMISIDAGHVTITPGTAFDALSVGHTSILSIGYTLTDGDGSKSSGTFNITINGANDAAVITGDVSASVTEAGGVNNGAAGVPVASGILSATDVDSDPSFTAQSNVATSYGHFTIGADGHWSYLLDNSNSAVQALNSTGNNTTLHDIVTVTTADGTSQQIDITINGTNDAPTITLVDSDSAAGSVTEAGVNIPNDGFHNTATGHLTGADVDGPGLNWSLVVGNGQTGNIDGSVTGAYGTLSVGANGTWTYVLDQSKADPLNISNHPQESFTVQLSDGQGGVTTQTVVVTVNGTNDAPTIALVDSDSAAGSVTEAGVNVSDEAAHNMATGHLTGADVDGPSLTWSLISGNGQTANVDGSVTGAYGTLSVGANGTWTYVLDQSKADPLNASDHPQESFTVQLSDGLGGVTTQTVVVTVNGTNDAPTISIANGDIVSGAVTEAGIGIANDSAHNTVSGHLTGADVDSSTLTWSVVAGSGQTANGGSVTGTYGTLSVGADGTWSYVLDQSKADTLTASDHRQESFTVQLSDGQGGVTTQTVVVTVNGTNDAPTITIANGDSASGAVTEAGIGIADDSAHNTISGHLTGADVDSTLLAWSIVAGSGQTANGGGSVTGTYGTLNVNANGIWTYVLDQSKADPLNVFDHPKENFTVQLSDGQGGLTTQTVVVTVNGTNDAASISGTATGSVTEDGQLTANGVLTVADVDNGQSHFQTPASLTGTYGTFTFNATTGIWGYTLNNSASNVQALNGGQTVTDKLTVASADGTASQDIVVTIHGANEAVAAPSISRVTDNVGSIKGSLADGAVTDDTNLDIRVSLAGTGAVSGDTVQLYNGTTVLGSAVTLTAIDISNGYVDITTPTLTNGSTYNFRASLTDAGTTSPLSQSGAYDIKIDTAPPTVAITQTHGSGVGTFTFTFSQAVSGFTAADITAFNILSLFNFQHLGLNGSGQDVYTVNFTYNSNNNGWKYVTVDANSYTDLAGNSGIGGSSDAFKPAGVSGEAINLAVTDPSHHVGAVTLSVAGLPAGWMLNEGTHNADGTWTVVTNNPSSLTVTSPDGVTGAVVLQVTETWTNADGSTGMATVADNVEAYAKGSPIFAWSGDDTLTASSGSDVLVFANTIGTDVVHKFDVAHDKIDLIGFAGFNSFADVLAHLSSDASGNAVITLGNGETITLAGVSAAALTADDFLFNEAVVTHNSGDMVIADGALMPFSGTLDNTGSIHISSAGSETDFEIVQQGLTLTGGGKVTLSDSASNVIFGSDDHVTLTNVDNTISGAGQIGDGHLTLVNEGTIIADGSHALVIDTGVNAVSNTGTLEATGAGGLHIHSDVVNNGLLWANGGDVNLDGNVSGTGTVLVSGHAGLEIGGSFNEAITLGKDAQATITIDHAAAFTGTIAGLDGNDALRFGDISAATASFSYTENAAKTGGVLTVTDGTHTASVGLTGEYSASDFSLGHDGTSAEIDFSGIGHLYGTDGNDTLTSGGGYTMTGGGGADTFVLDAKALHNLNMADVITDFSPKGDGDKLDVSNLLNALVGEHPGMTEASAVASMTAEVDTAANSTKISVNTGSETHVVATLQNYAPTGHDAVHVLFNNHEEQLATHAQTAGA